MPDRPSIPQGDNFTVNAGLFTLMGLIDHYGERLSAAAEADAFVDVVVTTAEVLALNATAIEMVAAPGAGKYLEFKKAIIHKPAGTAYAGIAATEDLAFLYTDVSGLDLAVCEPVGFLDQATAQTRHVNPQTGALAAGTVSSFVPTENAAIVLALLVGEIITGTSDLHVRVFYETHDVVVF